MLTSLLSPFNLLLSKRKLPEISREANDSFLDSLILTYGDKHPEIFRGSFKEISQRARQQSRLIMICINSQYHQDTEKFCRDVLFNSDELASHIDENFLLWVGDVGTLEGYKLAQDLCATTFPHISVVHPQGKVIKQIAGFRNETQLKRELSNLDQLRVVQHLHQNHLANVQNQERLERDRIIREEQEAAYQASLAADRQRVEMEAKKKEEEEKLAREEAERIKLEKDQESARKNLIESKKNNLPPEPTSGIILSLAFRLPNGKRIQRKFAGDNSVQTLYDFIDTHPENPNNDHLPYCLFSSFPKRQFPASETSLEDAKIPNHSVFDINFD